jgi:hypothetical protein
MICPNDDRVGGQGHVPLVDGNALWIIVSVATEDLQSNNTVISCDKVEARKCLQERIDTAAITTAHLQDELTSLKPRFEFFGKIFSAFEELSIVVSLIEPLPVSSEIFFDGRLAYVREEIARRTLKSPIVIVEVVIKVSGSRDAFFFPRFLHCLAGEERCVFSSTPQDESSTDNFCEHPPAPRSVHDALPPWAYFALSEPISCFLCLSNPSPSTLLCSSAIPHTTSAIPPAISPTIPLLLHVP